MNPLDPTTWYSLAHPAIQQFQVGGEGERERGEGRGGRENKRRCVSVSEKRIKPKCTEDHRVCAHFTIINYLYLRRVQNWSYKNSMEAITTRCGICSPNCNLTRAPFVSFCFGWCWFRFCFCFVLAFVFVVCFFSDNSGNAE
jgi:hypothetical protein